MCYCYRAKRGGLLAAGGGVRGQVGVGQQPRQRRTERGTLHRPPVCQHQHRELQCQLSTVPCGRQEAETTSVSTEASQAISL